MTFLFLRDLGLAAQTSYFRLFCLLTDCMSNHIKSEKCLCEREKLAFTKCSVAFVDLYR